MKILAIETSCDETAAAVLTEKSANPFLLSDVVSTQIDIHKEFGGVVPEVAARAHMEAILPVIEKALKDSNTKLKDITHIAVTYGPGLVGSLLVGVETAKGLSMATGVPVIPMNHLEGHIYANFLEAEPKLPLVTLIVSGGHTMLVLMRDHLDYEIIGTTLDDAAGEAFDKGAKLLGLGYPGGPIISALAEKGDQNKYSFPIIDLTKKPTKNESGFLQKAEPSMDFSFSGLKTALLNKVKTTENLDETKIRDLAAGYQKAIVESLVQNSLRATKKHKPKSFILSGGVSANKKLREELKKEIEKTGTKFYVPDFKYCTDNAAMIGAAAFYRIKNGNTKKGPFGPEPNLSF